MIKKHCKLLALGLIALSAVALAPAAQPVYAKGISGWHCNDYGEWTYVNAWFDDVTGWQQIGGNWYYFRGDGVMETGWRLYGHWYDLGSDGAMRTGWVKDDGDWYYLGGDGAMRTGWQCVSGSWYYLFPSSGRMASDCYIDGYHLNSSGAWDY